MVQSRRRVLREGLLGGLIGAGSVASWFLVVDLIAGRPFFTPAVLGSAVFWGLRDAAMVVIGFQTVAAYTVVHVLAFVLVGTIASKLLSEAEKDPGVLWLLIEFFVALEFGFHATVALVFTPLLAELAWLNVGIGNLIAAGVMGYYFWRVQPALHRDLDQRPPDDAENDKVAASSREAGARTETDDESASTGH
jgi:hypothetical protein